MNDIEIKNGLTIRHGESMFEERYRPSTIDECILPAKDKLVFKEIIKDGRVPHMILYSEEPGTGKTTVARALCEEIGADYLFLNGSNTTIDVIRGELTQFASTSPIFGAKTSGKVIILDEFDRKGLKASQDMLRSFMNVHSKNCTIIITANDINGISKPIQERCRKIHFGKPSKEDLKAMTKEMILRTTRICEDSNITFDPKVVARLILSKVPNFRSVTQSIDFYSKRNNNVIDEGILCLNTPGDVSEIEEIIDDIRNKRIKNLRKHAITVGGNFPYYIKVITDALYDKVIDSTKIRLIEIAGVSNRDYANSADHEILAWEFLTLIAVNMVFHKEL